MTIDTSECIGLIDAITFMSAVAVREFEIFIINNNNNRLANLENFIVKLSSVMLYYNRFVRCYNL